MQAKILPRGDIAAASACIVTGPASAVAQPWSDALIIGGAVAGIGGAIVGTVAASPTLLVGGLIGGVAAIGGGIARLWNGQPQPLEMPPVRRVISLASVAIALTDAAGYRDISTTAVIQRADNTFAIFTQRGYENMRESAEILESHELPALIPFVYPDSSDQPNIHAEMLAVSEWLLGNHPKPKRLGASRQVCHDCATVLQYLGIVFEGGAGGITPNWVSPYLNAGQNEPEAIRGRIPRRRTRGREYKD